MGQNNTLSFLGKIGFVAVIVALLVGGAWFFESQRRQQRQEVAEQLTAVAQLKAAQIADWRAERLADAVVLSTRQSLIRDAQAVLDAPPGAGAENLVDLLQSLQAVQEWYHFADILLVDRDGQVRLSLETKPELHQEYISTLEEAIGRGQPLWSPLQVDPAYSSPHMSVALPLYAGAERQYIGAFILVSDASQFLYPLLQSWPTPTESGEILLVRREGEEVLFLNEVRYQDDAALRLRFPLSQADLPAAMAARGQEGIVEGKDYRGEEVAAALLPIPDSPWFLVAKMDVSEAFAEWQFRSALILGLILGLVAFLASAGLVAQQRTRKAYYRALYQTEAEFRASLERQSITLRAIGDAVIATDAQRNVELMNPTAESLTGWTEEEARGKPLDAVFSIINEETRRPAADPVKQVLEEGRVVGLANHTLLIARDGREIPIADSGAPIRDESGAIIGVVLVFRDQSEERLSQRLTELRLELIAYAENHTLDQLLARALDSGGAFVNSSIGFYHFVDEAQENLTLQQWSTRTLNDFCQAEGKGSHYPVADAGVWADCVRQKEAVVHNDYASLPHKKGMPEGHAELTRELVVPVLRGGRVVAILGVGNKPEDYTEKDVEIVSYLADITWEIIRKKRAEEALRESEDRFRKAFDTELVAWAISRRRDGTYLEANPGFLKLTGYSRDEIVGHTSQELGFFTAAQRRALLADLAEAENRLHNRELTFSTKMGQSRTILYSIGPITVDGEACLAATMVDITGRKQAEQALRDSEARYRTLFESAKDAILIMEGEIVVACNEAAVQIYGCDHKSDLLGKTPWAFSPARQLNGKDSKQKATALIQRALREGQQFEWVSAKKDGTPFYAEIALNRVSMKGKRFVQVIVRDVTERKEAEQERERLTAQIREQARQMRQVLVTVPAGVVLLDAERRLLQANPVAEQEMAALLKAEKGDILSKLGDHPLEDLLTSPPTRGLWHEVKGERGVFEVLARPVENGPEAERWVMVIKDVTQEREIRRQLRQQERLAAVGQLASGIAHDFNNIMAVIVLYAQMELYAPNLSEKSREHLHTIARQAKRATDLIQQILDFSRSAMLERRPLDLAPFLKEIVKLLERTVPENIAIDLNVDGEECVVNVDPTRVQQAVMNLALNARDAMPEGGELCIALSKTSPAEEIRCTDCGKITGEEWVQVAVTDTGAGIPSDVLPRIFEPFFTTKEVGQGTGLGLAQVYGIVKQHEGHIDVVTHNGSGTTFSVYLPTLAVYQPPSAGRELPMQVWGQGEVILVVEDNVTLRRALIETLREMNYRVLEAANGREALQILARENEIELVLSDLVMPEMGGQALFHAMRRRHLMQPVVMLSGHPMENELQRLQAEGLTGWLLKPIRQEELAKIVARALRGD